ncbi:trehalose operon repressor [Bacillus sp. 03113]|uniref:trehalose operon repressor n=1 Tax=Bacillus sp. 03113 TaxID=2578211 RepID=UPI0011440C21|nr:trehalose operon repressor [Bacillus sp. 03113]
MKSNKYYNIYTDLSNQIKKGEYKRQQTLPSENELAVHYNVSRETIRKALNLLSQNGFIQKIRGKGSVVINAGKMSFPVSGLVSFKELSKSLKIPYQTFVHDFEMIKADEFLQEQLLATNKDDIWKVVRIREINGEKIILDKDYILKKYIPFLTKEICENSIFEYIEEELNFTISFAKKEIVVEECTEEDRSLLDLNGFKHIVVVKNYIYLNDTSLFQYTESRHRLDKFRFVDFARRGK